MTSLRELGIRYIWGKPHQESKVNRVLSDNHGVSSIGSNIESISLDMLRKIALREPLVLKAIYKKNRDTFKNWFVVKTADGKGKVDKIDLKIIQDFDNKIHFPNVLFTTGVCANIYGTGFIEKTYNEHGNTKAINPPGKHAKLTGLQILDSEKIKSRKKSDKQGDTTLYPVYSNYGDDILVSPKRLEVVRIDWLPHNYFGISKIDVLLNILNSKMTADKASGDFVDWAGKGMFDLTIVDMNDEQEKTATKKLKQHPSYLIHDQSYILDVKNPSKLDPKSFYDYFYVNIAAGLEMPKHILTGADVGDVTGSEVGTSAYYSDVENIQSLVFTPIIESIYTELLNTHGREWKYKIDWNPIFVDELSEAKILQTRSYSATQSVNANILSIPEARAMLNDGIVELDVEKIPEVEEPAIPTTDPNIEPQPVAKKEFIPLTAIQKKMIKDWRDYCKREEEDQENRLAEAKKVKK